MIFFMSLGNFLGKTGKLAWNSFAYVVRVLHLTHLRSYYLLTTMAPSNLNRADFQKSAVPMYRRKQSNLTKQNTIWLPVYFLFCFVFIVSTTGLLKKTCQQQQQQGLPI